MKIELKDIENQIETYKSTADGRTPDQHGDSFKLAKSMQDKFRKNSKESIVLEKFKNYLVKLIRKDQKQKPIQHEDVDDIEGNTEEEGDIYEKDD